jgi:hypothetical protein
MQASAPSLATPGSPRAAKRPVAVTFVGLLGLIVGGYHVAHGVAVVVEGGDSSRLAEGAFDLVLGGLAIAIGFAALRMRRWAWVAFMTWALVGLVHQLLRHFFYDHPDYLAMALDTVAVLFLTPLDVQIAFGVRSPRHVALERASRNPGELG